MRARDAHPLAWIVLSSIAFVACSSPTQLVVVVDTNMAVPDEIDLVEVVITGPDGVRTTTPQSLVEEGAPELPLTLGVAPSGSSLGPIEVAAVGRLGDQEVVRRAAEVTLVAGETRVLHLVLYRSCAGRACPEGQSCDANGCVPEEVDDLPLWTGEPPSFDGSDPCVSMRWDEDGDGDGSRTCGGTDCDDADPRAYGGASESCDLVDNDCDGTVDEACPCAPLGAIEDCETPCGSTGDRTCEEGGWSECVLRAETCNMADDDCDGASDEGFDYVAGPPVQITMTSAASIQPALIWADDRYALAWSDTTDAAGIHLLALDAAGTPMGAPVRVSTDGQTPDIAWSGSAYGVVWSQRTSTSGCCDATCASTCTTYYDHIYFRTFDRDGTPLIEQAEPEGDADTDPRPSVVWNGTHFVVGYPDSGTWLEERAEDGTELSRERIPSRTGPFDLVHTTGTTYAITLTRRDEWYFSHGMSGAFPMNETILAMIRNAGRPALAWTGQGYVAAVRAEQQLLRDPTLLAIAIDPTGIARAALPTALSTTVGTASGFFGLDVVPGVAGAPSQAVITWDDGRSGNADIYFARMGSSGELIQPATPVAVTEGASTMSAVAFAGDGFGVVWSESETLSSAGDLFFARVSCPP